MRKKIPLTDKDGTSASIELGGIVALHQAFVSSKSFSFLLIDRMVDHAVRKKSIPKILRLACLGNAYQVLPPPFFSSFSFPCL